MENLKALVKGIEMTPYQRALATREFVAMERRLNELEQQLKNCNLQSVSQQRDLFVSFARFAHNYGKGSYGTSYEEMFSEWLKKKKQIVAN